MKNEHIVKQPNALLTFIGEQDAEAFAAAILAVCEKWTDEETDGSRELSLRSETFYETGSLTSCIVLGYKKEMDK